MGKYKLRHGSIQVRVLALTLLFTLGVSLVIAIGNMRQMAAEWERTTLFNAEYALQTAAAAIHRDIEEVDDLASWCAYNPSMRTYLLADASSNNQALSMYPTISAKYSTLRTMQYVQRFVLINAKGRQMVFGTAVTNTVAMTPEVLARIPGYDEEYSGWSCIMRDPMALPSQALDTIPLTRKLTLSGTGREAHICAFVSPALITAALKGFTMPERPRFAVMDPELTFTLPAYQTASGCVDIIYHTMERYFSGAETVEPTDSMAEGLMRSMLELSRRVVRDPRDYDARAGIMWAGSLSHNSLTGCGRGGRGRIGDWASHQLEHELSGMFDVTHGAGLAAVWGAWSRYVMDAAPERFARFARAVMGVDTPGSDEETALAGIRAFEHFLRSIGMPTTVGQLGITLDEQAIEKLAWMCTFEGRRTIGSFKVLGLEEIKDIYRAAR